MLSCVMYMLITILWFSYCVCLGQRLVSELSDYTFTIHYKPGVENTVAGALSRSTKLHRYRDEGNQVTISPDEISSILPSTDNNFKAKSVWKANLNAAGIIDQIENRFLDAKTLTVIPASLLKGMQYDDEQISLVVKVKQEYHQELPKKSRIVQTPEVKKLLWHWPKLKLKMTYYLEPHHLKTNLLCYHS